MGDGEEVIDWARLRADVNLRIDVLEALMSGGWSCAGLQPAVTRDLCVPLIRLLAQFVTSIDLETDAGEWLPPRPAVPT